MNDYNTTTMSASPNHSTEPRRLYRGRFAPSPSGDLHFGSLVAAVGSFLQARSRDGEWLVRMEDLDPPREVKGAADSILRTLEAFGLYWDGTVMVQSQRSGIYRDTVERLLRDDLAYPCGCSRRDLVTLPDGRRVYPGTCRTGLRPGATPRSVRIRCAAVDIAFEDQLQGVFRQDLERQQGDFIVRRADGYYAYHLAVVVDDGEQGITEVVRGNDLIDSTPSHIHLQRLLGLPTPTYLHLPMAMGADGAKLSKQTHAPPLGTAQPAPTLVQCLEFLRQEPPADLAESGLEAVWEWAIGHWRPERLRYIAQRIAPGDCVQC